MTQAFDLTMDNNSDDVLSGVPLGSGTPMLDLSTAASRVHHVKM